MQDNMIPPVLQPFMKLAQANMEVLTRFSLWPAAVQSGLMAPALMQQAQQAAASLLQPNACAQLAQGMLKNYTDFMMEWGESGMAMLAQSQAAIAARAQEITNGVVEAAELRGRRTF